MTGYNLIYVLILLPLLVMVGSATPMAQHFVGRNNPPNEVIKLMKRLKEQSKNMGKDMELIVNKLSSLIDFIKIVSSIFFRCFEGNLLLSNLAGMKMSVCIRFYQEVYPPSQTKVEPVT